VPAAETATCALTSRRCGVVGAKNENRDPEREADGGDHQGRTARSTWTRPACRRQHQRGGERQAKQRMRRDLNEYHSVGSENAQRYAAFRSSATKPAKSQSERRGPSTRVL